VADDTLLSKWSINWGVSSGTGGVSIKQGIIS
jgi:hypothetical protein